VAEFEEFASFQFELGAEEEGGTVLEHLLAIQQATGQVPQMLLDAPECPEGCEDLWQAFCELSDCRAWPYGPRRITYSDIDAFQRVTGRKLATWELEAIRRADAEWLRQWSERNPKRD
jgi:hypothetical protein